MAMKRKNLPDFAIEIFENEFFGQIRYVRPDPDFDPWFIAVDVCKVLGLSNVTKALYVLDEDELTLLKVRSGGQVRKMNFVNEARLYRLIMSSRKPEAKKFQRWVYHEVLPSIRNTVTTSRRIRKSLKSKAQKILRLSKLNIPKAQSKLNQFLWKPTKMNTAKKVWLISDMKLLCILSNN